MCLILLYSRSEQPIDVHTWHSSDAYKIFHTPFRLYKNDLLKASFNKQTKTYTVTTLLKHSGSRAKDSLSRMARTFKTCSLLIFFIHVTLCIETHVDFMSILSFDNQYHDLALTQQRNLNYIKINVKFRIKLVCVWNVLVQNIPTNKTSMNKEHNAAELLGG